MRIDIITLFPQFFQPLFSSGILKRAKEKGLIKINLSNLRDFGIDKRKIVDDKPYGGGTGMILRVDVLYKALKAAGTLESGVGRKKLASPNYKPPTPYTILLDPTGQKYDQKKAVSLSQKKWLILICGHYEGFDERIRNFVDCQISIGDFILSGGELAAMVIVDSVTRLLRGVLSKKEATQIESFSQLHKSPNSLGRQSLWRLSTKLQTVLEFPQYTRPENFLGLKVPATLLSGDHQKIEKWRREKALEKTKRLRPDLLKS